MATLSATPRYHAVVSDLHFGDGLALEDFIYEEEFLAFVDHVHRSGVARGGTAELIINGDFIDFLQIEPLAPTPWRESIQKLHRVARSHRRAFDALGKFVADGNRLVILPGNHDIELMFKDVQAALVQHLVAGDAAAAARVVFPDEPLGSHFRGWQRGPFAYRLPGVYIEHGNQFDVLNYFDHGDFYEPDDKSRIKLPWGSHFVLDLFNDVEARHRFIDKLRPRQAAILILWLLDPKLVKEKLAPLRAQGPRLFTELRRYRRPARAAAGSGSRAVIGPAQAAPADPLLELLADEAEALETVDRFHAQLAATPGGHRGVVSDALSVAYASIFRKALDQMTSRPDAPGVPDEYTTHAIDLARANQAEVVVFGHTHGVKDISEGGARYLNTGTWIGLVDLDRQTLQEQSAEQYHALLDRLKDSSTFVPLKLLTFAEIAYPEGRLTASVRLFRDGAPLPLPRD